MLRIERPLLAACLVLLGACASPSSAPPIPRTPDEWVRQNAHPVRSISPTDYDFRDLEPLREAIGDARIVMLGEQSHGDGATFLAKARLVAFLHREMGFDVLAWESGIYDVDRVWRQISAGEDVLTASRRGIFAVWAYSEQARPVFAYVAGTLGTPRPLEMAGFDLQLTTLSAHDSLAYDVDRFAREIGSAVVRDPEWPTALRLLGTLPVDVPRDPKPPAAEQATFLRLVRALRADAAAAGGRRAMFWAQALESTDAAARMVWAEPANRPGSLAGALAREAQMSRNLVWLAHRYHSGRKIIVWGASTHLGRNLGDLRSATAERRAGDGWVSMGEQVHGALGAETYTLGFTAGRGTWGRGGTLNTLAEPVPESLEARLDQLEAPYAFVDFRRLGAGGEWLRDSQSRPLFYQYEQGDWTRVFDGMFYTREMTPSTRAAP